LLLGPFCAPGAFANKKSNDIGFPLSG